MPHRLLVSQKLAGAFAVLSHPVRIRIIIELRSGELCVNELHERLAIVQSTVSQHLSHLKSHNFLRERRAGRNVFYSLVDPSIADWVTGGLRFITPNDQQSQALKSAIERTRVLWSELDPQEIGSELERRQESQSE